MYCTYRPRDTSGICIQYSMHARSVTSVCPLCACVRICHIHRTAVHTLTCMQDHIMDTRSFVCVRGCARVGVRAWVCARGCARVGVRAWVCACVCVRVCVCV